MEAKKPRRFGMYALVIGITAGFVFLIALFSVLDQRSDTAEKMIWVAIAASSISIFLSSMESTKKKSCKASTSKL